MRKKTDASLAIPSVLTAAPLLTASQRAGEARVRLQQRAIARMSPGRNPLTAVGDVVEMLREAAIERHDVINDAVLEVLEKGEAAYVMAGKDGASAITAPLTTQALLDLAKVSQLNDATALTMLGLPSSIKASYTEVSGEMTYKGQRTKPAVEGDEITAADLGPCEEGILE